MSADRPFFGILLMLAFCVLAPLGDSIAKVLGGRIPLVELLLARFALQALFLLPVVLAMRISLNLKGRVLRLTVVRTVLHILGTTAMFAALRYLPLADAIAIAFVMPFIMLILGKTVLNEDVGTRRILACLVGFGGTLLVIQPSFASVGLPALLPLAVALIFALFMLVTRQIAKEVDPLALQCASGLIATPILLLAAFAGTQLDLPGSALILPNTVDTMLVLAIGVIGTVAHLLMTWSLRLAPSTTLAPMQYLEIPMATLLGWIVFGDLPNGLAALGIVITILSGLYIIYREQQIAPGAAPLA